MKTLLADQNSLPPCMDKNPSEFNLMIISIICSVKKIFNDLGEGVKKYQGLGGLRGYRGIWF